eukprot:gene3763-4685_t
MKLLILVSIFLFIFVSTNNALKFTATDKINTINFINTFRRTGITQPPPTTPLVNVTWDATLEALALSRSQNCNYDTFKDNVPGYYNFGISWANTTNPASYIAQNIPLSYKQYSYYRRDCIENTSCMLSKMVTGDVTTKFACAVTSCYANVEFIICLSSNRVADNSYPYQTLPKYKIAPLNSTNIGNILKYHTTIRTEVKPKPVAPGITSLQWNNTLAVNSQKAAESCLCFESQSAAYNLVNEWKVRISTNELSRFPLETLLQATNASWTYDYWTNRCNGVFACETWRWLIQNTSKSIGCGISPCYDNKGFFGINLVCQYYPPAFRSSLPYRTNEQNPNPPVPTPDPKTSSSDWVAARKVSSAKNQKSCGSCWAFASVGALESQYLIKFNSSNVEQYDLSEQQLVNCVKSGCNGGWPKDVFSLRKNVTLEVEIPYLAKDNQCTNSQKLRAVTWKSFVDVPNTKADFIKALKNNGPLVITLMADGAFQSYRGGIFEFKQRYTTINHAVLLVGYNAKEDYWVIKNSWGPTWGENGGYMRIKCDVDDWGNVYKYNAVVPVI